MDGRVAILEAFPKLVGNLMEYDTFMPQYDKECYRAVNSIMDKAFELKGCRMVSSKPTEKELRKA